MRGRVSRGIVALGMALGLVVGVEAWQEPEAFKGVRWGSPPAELQRVLAVEGCRWVARRDDDEGSVTYHLSGGAEWYESCLKESEALKRIRRIGEAELYGAPTFSYQGNRLGAVSVVAMDWAYVPEAPPSSDCRLRGADQPARRALPERLRGDLRVGGAGVGRHAGAGEAPAAGAGAAGLGAALV